MIGESRHVVRLSGLPSRLTPDVVAALVLLLAMGIAGCGQGGGSQKPGPCVDTSRMYALPSPLWETEAGLVPPAGDRAAALLGEVRPGWLGELAGAVDGWPARPTVVIPLDGAAGGLDPAGIRWFTPDGAELQTSFQAGIEGDGRYILIIPADPVPPDLDRVILVVERGAVMGAEPLPACGPGGEPHPAYGQAADVLPGGVDAALALPVEVATTHLDLVRLAQSLTAEPIVEAEQVEARTLDSFGERSAGPEVAALLADTAASGILALADYRGADGVWSLDAAGMPIAAGTTRPGFVVTLPAQGAPPHPFVLFQHGGTQDKADVFAVAGPLAEAGFALVAIDLPYHGDRAAPGGGGDLDILDFESPLRTRDNLRQASADHLAVLAGIERLNAALAPVLGSERALDPERAFYMGLSLGGISGSMTFAAGHDLDAAALFVAAGGYPEILSYGLFSLFINDVLERDPLERAVLLGLAEVLLDGADPVAYGQRAEDRTAPPRPALFLQAIDDPVIDMPASDRWARAYGADLARAFHHPVEGMLEIDLPAADNFCWQEGGARATRLLVHNPMDEVPQSDRHGGLILQDYAQQMVAHCFETLREAGSCEVIDTGFAEH